MAFWDDYEVGYDDGLNIPTAGLYGVVKATLRGGDSIDDDVSEAVSDYGNVGKNNFNATPYEGQPVYWGGDPNAAANYSQMGQDAMGRAQGYQDWAMGQAMGDRGPQAHEDQTLSNREADSRYGDQAGALQLAREAAMGQAPSEAAYMMQRGLDQAVAGQQSAAGSARGAAAMAQAQGNAAANTANLQNQAFTQAGQLRANEMATARGMYGGLAGQARQQDLERLGQGSDMAKFNAGLNDKYKTDMMNAGGAYGNQGLGYYGQAMSPYNQQLGAEGQKQQLDYQANQGAQELNAGIKAQEANRRQQEKQGWTQTALTLGGTVAQGGFGGGKGGGGMGGT